MNILRKISKSIVFYCLIILGTLSCSTTNRAIVGGDIEKYQSPVVASARIEELLRAQKIVKTDREYLSSLLSTLLDFQEAYRKELGTTGAIRLMAGRSYELDLESFCLEPGEIQPVVGDELRLEQSRARSGSWLYEISERYRDKGISQRQAQVLIWSLQAGLTYEELNSGEQKNLMRIFPDAQSRFSKSIWGEQVRDIIENHVPSEVRDLKERFSQFKELLQDSSRKYEDLEQELAPRENNRKPDLAGWNKTTEGYYIKLTSKGYQQTNVQIYVPDGVKGNIHFRPSDSTAHPKVGQQIGLTKNAINIYAKDYASRGSYYITGQKLNDKEQELVVKYPMDAAQVGYLVVKSSYLTKMNFQDEELINNKADAFRHYTWSALVTREIGEAKGRLFLDAHEEYSDNHQEEKKMDLHNNEQGIQYAKSYQGEDFERDLVKSGLEKIRDGELIWLQ